MSGREAIEVVRRMSSVERREASTTSNDATLRLVAGWPLTDPAGWYGLLDDLGDVDIEKPHLAKTAKARTKFEQLIDTWASRAWTYQELAAATGLSPVSLAQYKRSKLKGFAWTKTRTPMGASYQLVKGAA